MKWLQLVIEVSEVIITRNTANTFNLLHLALYSNCRSQEIFKIICVTDMIIKLKEHFGVHTTIAKIKIAGADVQLL